MKLADLVTRALGESATEHRPLPDVDVTGVVQHSGRVEPGSVFVARRGATSDGHRFARLAIERGAVAVVGEHVGVDLLPWRATPYIHVADDRVALAKLAATFHGHPSRSLRVLGVTGTDGKTTTSFLLHHLLQADAPTGLLSTAGIRLGTEALPLEGHFTTPESPEVQRMLARFVASGATHAVVESSSHGLAAHRLDEIEYDIAVWTNLSPEHLDYHETMDAYLAAKRTLVERSPVAVLNQDDPHFEAFADAGRRVVTYGLGERAQWRATGIEVLPGALRFQVHHGELLGSTELPMIGRYNVHNALAALAAATESGADPQALVPRLATFPGVPGRMEVVQSSPFGVVVDFAHTPTSLTRALEAARESTTERVLVVIGAAGERDPAKRQPLGEIAARHADMAIFTEEDSRSEDPEAILADIVAGAERTGARRGERFQVEPDRRLAIRAAVARARPGDVVILCGKGHESTLERKDEVLPWNEVAEARAALAARPD